ncbi:ParB/RepB/Spo0J family partition protein [Cuneatibacter sp. NSJ-177]|uniref:ParB/RepB/Spo0J family partition protein n=1 Tax=Cuneatibacter sp. NSJ-177 TaxID=2931401 RepID=UPI001FD0E078|nr:ParB/RepB/Spo0J family partition protein [Cuneatibacter sp. NSJ-177]MCJ7836536.1 ParB/RepB/Spo0J family partition protein [Cuneatibacter sp. NSJ-177]
MTRKSGLGKGLDSLIPNSSTVPSTKSTKFSTKSEENVDKSVENPVDIPKTSLKLSQIEPNRDQPRKNFDLDALEELAESIRRHGVLQPLLVQEKGNHYEIIAGERRWRAAKLAGLKEVPVIIKEFSSEEAMEIALIENIQREDLNAVEEAQAYLTLIQEFHLKQEEVAEKVGKSRAAIANRLRLLKLPKEVLDLLEEGKLSEGHARALLSLDQPDRQIEAAKRVVELQLTVRETEKLVKDLMKPQAAPKDDGWRERDQFIYDKLEDELRTATGTKVVIQRKEEGKGKIQMDYYSIEELERLVDLFRKL